MFVPSVSYDYNANLAKHNVICSRHGCFPTASVAFSPKPSEAPSSPATSTIDENDVTPTPSRRPTTTAPTTAPPTVTPRVATARPSNEVTPTPSRRPTTTAPTTAPPTVTPRVATARPSYPTWTPSAQPTSSAPVPVPTTAPSTAVPFQLAAPLDTRMPSYMPWAAPSLLPSATIESTSPSPYPSSRPSQSEQPSTLPSQSPTTKAPTTLTSTSTPTSSAPTSSAPTSATPTSATPISSAPTSATPTLAPSSQVPSVLPTLQAQSLPTISYALPQIRVAPTAEQPLDDEELLKDLTQSVYDFLSTGFANQGWALHQMTITLALDGNERRGLGQQRQGMLRQVSLIMVRETQATLPDVVLEGVASFVEGSEPTSLALFWDFIHGYTKGWEWNGLTVEAETESKTTEESTTVQPASAESDASATLIGTTVAASALAVVAAIFLFLQKRRHDNKKYGEGHSLFHSEGDSSGYDGSAFFKRGFVPDVVTLGISASGSFSHHSNSLDDDDDDDSSSPNSNSNDVSYIIDPSNATASNELPCLQEERQSQIDEEATTASRATSANPEYLDDHIIDTTYMLDDPLTRNDDDEENDPLQTSDFLVDVGSVLDNSFEFGGVNSITTGSCDGNSDNGAKREVKDKTRNTESAETTMDPCPSPSDTDDNDIETSQDEADDDDDDEDNRSFSLEGGADTDLPSVSSPSCSDAMNMTGDESVGITPTGLMASKWLRGPRASPTHNNDNILGNTDETDSDNSLDYNTDPLELMASGSKAMATGSAKLQQRRRRRRLDNGGDIADSPSLLGSYDLESERTGNIDQYFQNDIPFTDTSATSTPDLTQLSADDELLFFSNSPKRPINSSKKHQQAKVDDKNNKKNNELPKSDNNKPLFHWHSTPQFSPEQVKNLKSPTLPSPFPNLVTPPPSWEESKTQATTALRRVKDDYGVETSRRTRQASTMTTTSPAQPTSVLVSAMAGNFLSPNNPDNRKTQASVTKARATPDKVDTASITTRQPAKTQPSTAAADVSLSPDVNVPNTDEKGMLHVVTPPNYTLSKKLQYPSTSETTTSAVDRSDIVASDDCHNDNNETTDDSDMNNNKTKCEPAHRQGRTLPLLARMQEAKRQRNSKNRPSFRLWI
ncbi:hypothetical protein ACA910_010135 [Epithemia clementina (nom. ined.)]